MNSKFILARGQSCTTNVASNHFMVYDCNKNQAYIDDLNELYNDVTVKNLFTIVDNPNIVIDIPGCMHKLGLKRFQCVAVLRASKYTYYNHEYDWKTGLIVTTHNNCRISEYYKMINQPDNSVWYAESNHAFDIWRDLHDKYSECVILTVQLKHIGNLVGNIHRVIDLRNIDELKYPDFVHNIVEHLSNLSKQRFRVVDWYVRGSEPVFVLAVKPVVTIGCKTKTAVLTALNRCFEDWENNEKITDFVDNCTEFI